MARYTRLSSSTLTKNIRGYSFTSSAYFIMHLLDIADSQSKWSHCRFCHFPSLISIISITIHLNALPFITIIFIYSSSASVYFFCFVVFFVLFNMACGNILLLNLKAFYLFKLKAIMKNLQLSLRVKQLIVCCVGTSIANF